MIEGIDVKEKIMACVGSLGSWSREKRINFKKEISKRRERTRESMQTDPIHEVLGELKNLYVEIDDIKKCEEIVWA